MSDYENLRVVADKVALPLWHRYAIYVGGGSDKYYEVSIDLNDGGAYVLTKRWGRRPDNFDGQRKVEMYGSMAAAVTEANVHFSSKIGKGYTESERPTW
jgi:predicted DNA-binding WGR domain protein